MQTLDWVFTLIVIIITAILVARLTMGTTIVAPRPPAVPRGAEDLQNMIADVCRKSGACS